MNIERFYNQLKRTGGEVTISRQSVAGTFKVWMAGSGGKNDEQLLGEARQYDEEVVFCKLDFINTVLAEPQEGDRILDADGTTEFAIEKIKKMYGNNRELYGYRCFIRG